MTFTSDETAFLDGRRPATVGPDGRPHPVPVAVSVDTENHPVTAGGAA